MTIEEISKHNHILVDWILAKYTSKLNLEMHIPKSAMDQAREEIHKGMDNIINAYNEDMKNENI
jgi:hypothetical protein